MEGNIISFNENLSDSVILEDIEHIMVPSDKILSQWKLNVMLSAALLILLTNVSLIRLIMQKMSRTFLDNLMVLDSVSCICNMYSFFVMSNVIKLCNFSVPFIFTLNLFNRIVSFVTPLYRYVYVVQHELVDSVTKRRIFENCVSLPESLQSLLEEPQELFTSEKSIFHTKVFQKQNSLSPV